MIGLLQVTEEAVHLAVLAGGNARPVVHQPAALWWQLLMLHAAVITVGSYKVFILEFMTHAAGFGDRQRLARFGHRLAISVSQINGIMRQAFPAKRIAGIAKRHPVNAAALPVTVAALQRLVRIGHHVREWEIHFGRGEVKVTAVGQAGDLRALVQCVLPVERGPEAPVAVHVRHQEIAVLVS